MVMKRLSEYLFFWTLGGTLYYSFEMIFRGFSHWSMFMLGGFCLVFCIQQGIWTGWDSPLASGFMVQRFCDYGGIYYRDFSQQSDALARMGLQ